MHFTGLDIGSDSIRCLMGIQEGGDFRIIGTGASPSSGVTAGQITDISQAHQAISQAVSRAERGAGRKVEGLVVSLNRSRPQSRKITHEIQIGSDPIQESDIRRLVLDARAQLTLDDQRALLHFVPVNYTLDSGPPIKNPLNLYGNRLRVTLSAITADLAPIKNIHTVLDRCHLKADRLVFAPYAAGLSVLEAEERDMGAIVIDLGAETTGVTAFIDNALCFASSIPLGGKHIVADIARGLGVSRQDAKSFKMKDGNALAAASDSRQMIHYNLIGENPKLTPAHSAPRSVLTTIIVSRVEEILESVAKALAANDITELRHWRIILTGGGASLPGMTQLISRLFNSPARVGKPKDMIGLPTHLSGPGGATLTGLLCYARDEQLDQILTGDEDFYSGNARGFFPGILRWFRKNY